MLPGIYRAYDKNVTVSKDDESLGANQDIGS